MRLSRRRGSRGAAEIAEVGTDNAEAFFAAWRLGGLSFPCPITAQGSGSKAAKPQSRQGVKASRRPKRRVDRACDDAGAMPASACEAFLGQAPEDRNGCCLKKYKETQKGGNAGNEPGERRFSSPFFEFFSFFCGHPSPRLRASA
jgi:hypothetical protein